MHADGFDSPITVASLALATATLILFAWYRNAAFGWRPTSTSGYHQPLPFDQRLPATSSANDDESKLLPRAALSKGQAAIVQGQQQDQLVLHPLHQKRQQRTDNALGHLAQAGEAQLGGETQAGTPPPLFPPQHQHPEGALQAPPLPPVLLQHRHIAAEQAGDAAADEVPHQLGEVGPPAPPLPPLPRFLGDRHGAAQPQARQQQQQDDDPAAVDAAGAQVAELNGGAAGHAVMLPATSWAQLLLEDNDDEPDVPIPDEYKDPISFSVIRDPVLLCATGQVYDYANLKDWFRTGNRLCPKTNIEVVDAQVTRLPWLKSTICEWMQQHGMRPFPPDDTHLQLTHIRTDSSSRRVKATADLYEFLRQMHVLQILMEKALVNADKLLAMQDLSSASGWEAQRNSSTDSMERHRIVREAVMDEMVWLIRYADPYLQGVAASILAYCDSPPEVQWLAASAAIPAVALCLSPNNYTSQAATRMLYNISRAGDVARRTIKTAGGVQSLLKIIATNKAEYGYCRDRAAATLAVMARDPEVKAYLHKHALEPLKNMLLQSDDRWEKRDAATALLKLQFTQEELGADITVQQLCEYWWCSRSWLEGGAGTPDEGCTQEEMQVRTDLVQMQLHASWGDQMDFIMGQDLDLDGAAAAVAAIAAEPDGAEAAVVINGAVPHAAGVAGGDVAADMDATALVAALATLINAAAVAVPAAAAAAAAAVAASEDGTDVAGVHGTGSDAKDGAAPADTGSEVSSEAGGELHDERGANAVRASAPAGWAQQPKGSGIAAVDPAATAVMSPGGATCPKMTVSVLDTQPQLALDDEAPLRLAPSPSTLLPPSAAPRRDAMASGGGLVAAVGGAGSALAAPASCAGVTSGQLTVPASGAPHPPAHTAIDATAQPAGTKQLAAVPAPPTPAAPQAAADPSSSTPPLASLQIHPRPADRGPGSSGQDARPGSLAALSCQLYSALPPVCSMKLLEAAIQAPSLAATAGGPTELAGPVHDSALATKEVVGHSSDLSVEVCLKGLQPLPARRQMLQQQQQLAGPSASCPSTPAALQGAELAGLSAALSTVHTGAPSSVAHSTMQTTASATKDHSSTLASAPASCAPSSTCEAAAPSPANDAPGTTPILASPGRCATCTAPYASAAATAVQVALMPTAAVGHDEATPAVCCANGATTSISARSNEEAGPLGLAS